MWNDCKKKIKIYIKCNKNQKMHKVRQIMTRGTKWAHKNQASFPFKPLNLEEFICHLISSIT